MCLGLTCKGQVTGLKLVTYSSAPLKAEFSGQVNTNLDLKRNIGFQLNLSNKVGGIRNFNYDFSLGLDSYNFDLRPNGIIRSFFIGYLGLGIGYEFKKPLKKENFLSIGGGISFLHFLGARSLIIDRGISNTIVSETFIGGALPVVFSPNLNISYNWQTESLRSFQVGIYAATSFQNILVGDFTIRDGNDLFSGSISKKHEYVGIQLGINVSQARRERAKERAKKGLLKDPKPINNTISVFSYAANVGSGSKLFISNPNTFAADKPEKVNFNLTYGFDISRSIPILDKYHALLAFSYHANDSKLRAVYRDPVSDERVSIDTRLKRVHVISGGVGYNFLKNKKNRPNFFQLAAIINVNVNLIEDQTLEIQNPIDDTPIWELTSMPYVPVFFSRKLVFNHYRKWKGNKYLRLGLSVERGLDLVAGEIINNTGAISEFYQNNFAIRFHVGILLKSERSKI